jgi:hypothetical protein
MRVVSYQRRVWVCLFIPLKLLGNNSIKTFPRQRIIVGGVVFCAVCVLSKKNGIFFLPRTFSYVIMTFRFVLVLCSCSTDLHNSSSKNVGTHLPYYTPADLFLNKSIFMVLGVLRSTLHTSGEAICGPASFGGT